ncbi:MAG: hypothetical protein LPK01_04035, partial [Hymenobacteraceae bacterium]|nr:hypothetical protein [Hymenobacteraceae bacterium]
IELLNFPYTKIKVIYGTNPGTNLSGPIPQMDNYTAEMRVTNASLTVLPDSLPMSTIDLSGNILQGTCKAPSVVNCWLSGQKAGSDFTIDLSIHTAASIAFLDIYNNAGKLKGINLPANKNVTVRFYGYLNDFPEFEWPAGFTVTGLFYMYSMTNWQNHIFPLGINIKSSTIRIDNNGMTESAVNGTVDSWLDNQAGFSGVEIVKTLMLHGNNAALTNLGRATRKQEVQQAIESNNWILYINDSVSSTYFRIEGIVSVAGSATDIIVQFNSAPNASAGTYSISNTVNFDGMDWSYVSKGTDANATNNSNGVFVRLTKVGFNNSGKASETGTIKKN